MLGPTPYSRSMSRQRSQSMALNALRRSMNAVNHGACSKRCHLLCKLSLRDGRPSPLSLSEAMECVIELDGIYPSVHDGLYHFPYWFKEANTLVVPFSLQNKDHYHPSQFLGDMSLPPDLLDEAYKEPPTVPCALSPLRQFFILLLL